MKKYKKMYKKLKANKFSREFSKNQNFTVFETFLKFSGYDAKLEVMDVDFLIDFQDLQFSTDHFYN